MKFEEKHGMNQEQYLAHKAEKKADKTICKAERQEQKEQRKAEK
jgi:hypothetical protein